MKKPIKKQSRILLVDDNPSVLKLLSALFLEENMEVFEATSVAMAREIIKEETGRFDLVLSDISMPKETGFDLLDWIKNKSDYRELPVLLTTAQLPQAENRIKGLEMGAVDYVVRPIELKELVLRAVHAIKSFARVKRLESSLADSKNLAQVGQLLAASNHEIKNLVTMVKFSSEQIANSIRRIDPTPLEEKLLTSLLASSGLLAEISTGTFMLLSEEQISVRPTNFGEVVTQMVELMQPRLTSIRCIIDNGESPYWVEAHPTATKQIILNLVKNAREAINELAPPEGGCIRIKFLKTDSMITIRVEDNGIGMSSAKAISEFKPFQTTKKLRGGQGLGLWLCSQLVHKMKGTIQLRSEGVGKGSCAELSLPISLPPEEDINLEDYFIDDF